jgi:signal-transduction protein with cAMP-binding, CBS, and nucleotidyltransferase domain
MHNIRHILSAKGQDIWSVQSQQTDYEAVRTMAELGVGALMVIDDGKLVGMFSERDYARKVILAGRASRETFVKEVMTENPITIHPSATAQEGLALMTKRRFRHLPVFEEGELLGLVSIGDLVNAVIDDQQALIEQLERYVSGQ